MEDNIKPKHWKGLYQDWGWITKQSYTHPAKCSPALLWRIIETLEEMRVLQKGDIVFDPMAGTGITAIGACLKSYRAITLELEPKFVEMQRENKQKLEDKLGHKVDWTILQGNARELSQLLHEKGLIGISSPPYSQAQTGGGIARVGYRGKHIDKQGKNQPDKVGDRCGYTKNMQGETEGQIANLPDFLVAVTSPPYANPNHSTQKGIDKDDSKLRPPGAGWGKGSFRGKHSENPDNIGHLEQGKTYLSAMYQVYSECARCCKALVTITKNPTRKGILRCLDLDTRVLLERCGFKVVAYYRSMLFEETEETNLFGIEKKKVDGRLSFFKRLAYQKGAVIAQWEDVFISLRVCG